MIWLTAPDTAWYDVCSLEESQYRVMNHNFKKHGYRLRRLSAFDTKDGVRYAALWELASGPAWESSHTLPLAKFETLRNTYKQSGYRMTHIDARVNYSAVWEKGDNSSQQVFTALTLLEYEQQYNVLTAQGLRPYRISATAQDGVPQLCGDLRQSFGDRPVAGAAPDDRDAIRCGQQGRDGKGLSARRCKRPHGGREAQFLRHLGKSVVSHRDWMLPALKKKPDTLARNAWPAALSTFLMQCQVPPRNNTSRFGCGWMNVPPARHTASASRLGSPGRPRSTHDRPQPAILRPMTRATRDARNRYSRKASPYRCAIRGRRRPDRPRPTG